MTGLSKSNIDNILRSEFQVTFEDEFYKRTIHFILSRDKSFIR